MSLKLKTPPATEPISIIEAKDYLGVAIAETSDDALITAMIMAVRERGEQFTRRAWITQTWTLFRDTVPALGRLSLPKPPLQSVTLINSYGVDNVSILFPAANYAVDINSTPGRVVLNSGAAWPSSTRTWNAFEVEFTAGYGAATPVPETLKEGMRQYLKFIFVLKSKLFKPDETTPDLAQFIRQEEIPPHVKTFWGTHKVLRI